MRRCVAEFIGTLVIVFAPVSMVRSTGLYGIPSGLLPIALISGLSVLAMISALGPISGAHFNPAVTLGFAVVRRFPRRHVIPYCLAQLSGGIAAAAILAALIPAPGGAHIPTHPAAIGRNFTTEAFLGFLLMFVIAAVATNKRFTGGASAVAISMTVVVGVMIGGPITGGSMNPARSLGPALFQPDALPHFWIYAVGPCLGAIAAALAYERIRIEPIPNTFDSMERTAQS